MSRLLRADFARLWRSLIFWNCVMFGVGLAAAIVILNRNEQEMPRYMETYMIVMGAYMGFVAAVFVSMFIGTEYSDGTLRNKLTVGHGRCSVYLSNMVVCVFSTLITDILYMVTLSGLSKLIFGDFDASVGTLMKLLLISLVAVVALTAISLLMAMLIHSKAIAAVAAIIVSLVMMMSASTIDYKLAEPEYIDTSNAVYVDENGEIKRGDDVGPQKNSNYVTGVERKIYEALYDWMPTGQMMQLMSGLPEHPVRLTIYSACIIIVTTGAGMFFFRRKNLK